MNLLASSPKSSYLSIYPRGFYSQRYSEAYVQKVNSEFPKISYCFNWGSHFQVLILSMVKSGKKAQTLTHQTVLLISTHCTGKVKIIIRMEGTKLKDNPSLKRVETKRQLKGVWSRRECVCALSSCSSELKLSDRMLSAFKHTQMREISSHTAFPLIHTHSRLQ